MPSLERKQKRSLPDQRRWESEESLKIDINKNKNKTDAMSYNHVQVDFTQYRLHVVPSEQLWGRD